MNDQEMQIAVATASGWSRVMVRENGDVIGIPPKDSNCVFIGGSNEWTFVRNYLNDLNACAEFEKILSYKPDYLFHLRQVVGPFPESQSEWDDNWWVGVVCATARQRCEAFLRVKGLWKDGVK